MSPTVAPTAAAAAAVSKHCGKCKQDICVHQKIHADTHVTMVFG